MSGSIEVSLCGSELRCGCGRLLAKLLPEFALELKCSRCKRVVVIQIDNYKNRKAETSASSAPTLKTKRQGDP